MFKNLRIINISAWSIDTILFDAIVDFIPKQKFDNVLDYGAGNSPFEKYIFCNSYIKLDIEQNVYHNIDVIINPDEATPFNDASFDLILLLDVLEHVNNPIKVLSEIRRILKPNGKLIISVPFIYREHETPYDMHRFTSFGLNYLINSNHGFLIRFRKVGNFVYTILSLILERGIYNGELVKLSFLGKLFNLILINLLLFFKYFLSKPPCIDSAIYHHLLAEVEFK